MLPGGCAYEPLRAAFARLGCDTWPTLAQLNSAATGIATGSGQALRFVAPREHARDERRYYEVRIFESGEVETRPGNWHDLYNALGWIAFPQAKAAINAQHASILAERGEAEARQRGPERDALTLFDECGVAVISSDLEVFRRIAGFDWKALFWDGRPALAQSTRFVAFGHGLFEQMRAPFPGLIAKTVFIESRDVDACDVDARLAGYFADRERFSSARRLAPMPVLGIPGWHPDNERETYYDDKTQFRGKAPKLPVP